MLIDQLKNGGEHGTVSGWQSYANASLMTTRHKGAGNSPLLFIERYYAT